MARIACQFMTLSSWKKMRRHPREGGDPATYRFGRTKALGSRLRGNDKQARGVSCFHSVRTRSIRTGMDKIHEDLLQRALAGMQILEVDAQLAQALQQRGDSGFLGLRVEGIDQRMAFVGQF